MQSRDSNHWLSFPSPSVELPSDLVGRWTDGSSFFEFRPAGWYFIGGVPRSYSVSTDGNTLQIGAVTYCRIGGAGDTIDGLWSSTSENAEWRFRSDGTDTYHAFGGDTYEGIYHADGLNLQRLEKRAFVIAEGNLLTFQPNWSRWQPAAYSRTGDQLTLVFGSGTSVWELV